MVPEQHVQDSRVLIVVDMERGASEGGYHGTYLNRRWRRRHGEVCDSVARLCEHIPRRVFIIDSRFRLPGHADVVSALEAYAEEGKIVYKSKDDGSEECMPLLSAQDEILVCGMNTDACVLRTARGLQRSGYGPAVVGDACWTVYAAPLRQFGKAHHDALSRMRREYGIPVLSINDIIPRTEPRARTSLANRSF